MFQVQVQAQVNLHNTFKNNHSWPSLNRLKIHRPLTQNAQRKHTKQDRQ